MVTIQCHGIRFDDIQAVIFDKDGTLANSESFLTQLGHQRSRLVNAEVPGIRESLLQAFGFVEGCLNPAGLMAVGTRRDNEIAAAAYVTQTGRPWIESLTLVETAFMTADTYFPHKADHTPLLDGSLPLIQLMKAVGLKLGILSSDVTANIQAFVQTHNLDPYFQLLMGADSGLTKPDPALFWQACEHLAVEPGKVLMIGDSAADFVMADAAGAAGCIGVTLGWKSPMQLDVDVAIANFNEIQVYSN